MSGIHYSAEIVPMYEVGAFDFVRVFDPLLLTRMAGDTQSMKAFEEEFERQARREAAERSLTVLQVASPLKWRDTPDGRKLLEIRFDVRHEPQADDALLRGVYLRVMANPRLRDNPADLVRAVVEAVRDLGRLTASVPRPESIPK